MKLQILADLHREFVPYETVDRQVVEAFAKMQNTQADLTIVAGDLHTKGRGPELAARMWPKRPVIAIAGNHEFYGKTWPDHIHTLRKNAEQYDNVHFLEKDVVIIDGVVFLGCTLWTDCRLWESGPRAGLYGYPETIRDIRNRMNDYGYITRSVGHGKTRRLIPNDTIKDHLQSVRWLKEQFAIYKGRKIVVITHHAPSYKSIPETYQQDIISAAYASHLDDLVEQSGAKFWIHGHNHSFSDYMIGKTRVICNPHAYPHELGKNGFKPALVVKISNTR